MFSLPPEVKKSIPSRALKKIIIAFAIGMAIYGYFVNNPGPELSGSGQQQSQSVNQTLEDAYNNHRSDIQIKGSGVVIKRLPDDNDGSRHQKFLLKVATGQTLLVAHNIDLADKITSLKKGDTVDFNGEYEWNSKGGVLHWTHHDPRGKHVNGWLKHKGKIYQ